MSTPQRVSKGAVRQFLLDKQCLRGKRERQDADGPDDVLDMIRSLECVQLDPVAAVERNQHLVLSSRLRNYRVSLLEELLENRQVFEYWANAACVIPMEDYPIFEGVRRDRSERLERELDGLEPIVHAVLKRLEQEGPLPAKAFESHSKVHGYWDNTNPKTKATSHVLNVLNDMGRILVVRREGTTRFFDIRDRAVPAHLLDQARRTSDATSKELLLLKYLRAYRVFDTADARFGWQRLTAKERGEATQRLMDRGMVVPLEIEDVKRPYFILSEDVEQLMMYNSNGAPAGRSSVGQVSILPPLDNLLWRRDRIANLFDFEYTWEVYIPAAKRKYGYYTMPILVGDQFIGRVDPRLDRGTGRLNLELLQIDASFRWTKSLQQKVFRALKQFAGFHEAELGDIARTDPPNLLKP